ncbi:MAG: HAMP domain-containing protein [Deltaproteobacteria bacterium]|nr:HAMP domain-containing protein [Deltaproteobacteria bacterium]
MKVIIDAVRRRMALKISLLIAVVMFVLMTILGAALVIQQVSQNKDAMNAFLLTKAQLASRVGADVYGTLLEQTIDTNLLTVADVFDRDYQLIPGYDWGKYPKYHTRYDAVLDKIMLPLVDSVQSDPDFLYSVGTDINGYVPVHNSSYQKKLTGDPDKDNVGNRTKRIYDDPVGIASAKNTTVGFQQFYNRDTGEQMWDVSSPIYVKGQHWGGFRIGVALAEVESRSAAILQSLLIGFSFLFIFVVGVLLFTLNRSLAPVRELTQLAEDISSGDRLDEVIHAKAIDEVGQMTKALDRLRVSMKTAIERLGG